MKGKGSAKHLPKKRLEVPKEDFDRVLGKLIQTKPVKRHGAHLKRSNFGTKSK